MSAHDFSLEILVDVPVDGPPQVRVHVDEHAATRPFPRVTGSTRVDRRPLPGVDLRPARQRAEAAEPLPLEPAPLPPPRHAWPSSAKRHPVPSRPRARALLEVPPPPAPRASPLSDDEERRIARRARAYKRASWANDMLEKLFAERAD